MRIKDANDLMTPVWFGPIMAAIGILILTLLLILSSRKDSREKGLTAVYSERCGGRFGFLNATFPFVRLSLYNDFLVISCFTKTIIEYERIRKFEDAGIFGSGIQIITTNSDKYGRPIIWSFNKKYVLELLNDRINETNRKPLHKHSRTVDKF